MAEWDLIESGYSAADETINFGTRVLGDCENLHETCTLATIKHSSETITCDKVAINSVVKHGKLYFSINKVFNVFETLQCDNVEFEVTFDEIVDSFCVLPEVKLLFVCLRNGSFYVFSISDATETVFVGTVVENTLLDEVFFVHCCPEIKGNNVKLWVVTKTGRLYSIIFDELLKKSEVEKNNQFELVAQFDHYVTNSAFSYPYLFVCGEKISTFDVENQEMVTEDDCSVKKISAVDKLLIGLQENGILCYICSETLILSEIITPTPYTDFVSIPNSYHILATTHPTDLQPPQIQLINCIGFDVIFSLNLAQDIFLIQPEHVHDETIYITRIQQQDGKVRELRFTNVYETSPEARLGKLLKKNRLDEAEAFVKLFGLDENVVRKARAQVIVDKSLCSQGDVDGLLQLLDAIGELEFSLQCCLDVHSCCERLVDVKRVLEYGCCEFPDGLESNLEICAMYATLSDFLFRFHTYVALLNNRGEDYDSNAWFEFSGCDLIEEVIIGLQKYKFQESGIIYSRLDRKTIENDLTQKIQDILKTLDKLNIKHVEPFLHVFIPVSLNLQPTAFPIFVKWLCTKILQLQQTDTQDFPENAIIFAGTITKMLRIESDTDISREICELTILEDGLKQLKVLRDDFRIIVPLQDYLEGPKHFIRTLLNLNFDMEGQDYGNFLQNYLYKYMLDNNLVPDDIFLEEINNLVQYEEKYWIETIPYILKCISSVENKLRAVLDLKEVAQMPWSKTISNIFTDCLQYSHPLVAKIRNHIENYPSRLILHKYGFLHPHRTQLSLSFRVGRIIYEDRPTMLEDLKMLCRNTEDVQTVTKILILHYLEIGDLAQAIETLQNNPDEIKLFLCKHFVGFIKNIINNEFASREIQKNCIEFLRPVCNELKKLSNLSSVSESQEKIIRNTYSINKIFGKKIKTHHLQIKNHKKALQEDLLCSVVQGFEDGALDVTKSLERVSKISKCLESDENDLLVQLCTKLQNFTLVHSAAEKMYTSPTNQKSLALMAILLLKHVGTSPQSANTTISDLNETFLPECSKTDLKIFMNAYQLAESLAARAILKAETRDLDVCCEVLNWVQSTYFMVCKETESVRQEIYKGSFGCDLVMPSYNSFYCVKNVFNLYVDYMRNYCEPNTRYLTYFNSGNSLLTDEQLEQQIRFLPQTVADLSTQGQTLTAFKLFLNLRSSLTYATKLPHTCIQTLNNIILNQCVPQLLQKVMSTRHFDADLAYDLFMLMDAKQVVKYVQQTLGLYKVDVVKFEAVARLSHRILGHFRDRAKQEKIMNIILTCKWWKKLKGSCPIRYVDFFKSNVNELAEKLIQFECLKGGLLEEFCGDFKLDLQTLLTVQLKSALIFWKPSYSVGKDVNGKRNLVMDGRENELFGACAEIVAKIADKDRLYEIVNSLWPQINFYYYEVFTAVLRLLEELRKNVDDGKRSLMLLFLKGYNRFSSPSEAEKGEWFTAFPDTQNLDPLSEFRLPFTVTFFTTDVWNLIRPEISLQTYKCWFEAVDILKGNLSKDEICCFVVKQVVANGLLVGDNNKEWTMYPKHEDLFMEIDLCVQQISDLKMATATVYHLMTHTPQGADLVKAATLCFKYALKYKENHPDAADVQRNFIKVQKQYLSYSAMHILHLNQLAEDRYLKLVSDPNELIDALYGDERIIKKLTSVVLNFPDINKTVEDLAELYQINIHQKGVALINNWLANATEVTLNSTIQFMPSYEPDLSNDVTTDDIKRAAYLCSGKDIEWWRDFLTKKGLCDTPPDGKNYIYRARALTCFCMITDSASILDLTGSSKNELMNFIAKLTLINDLQYQGYNFDVETLDAANKKEILVHLSQNISSSSNVRIMGALCMTYDICSLKYWKVIMKSANRLNMLKELKEYIEFLKPLAYCHHNKFYIDAWQRVIDGAVNATGCVEALRTIQNCPVLYSLKFNHLVEKFINLKRPECAAILLQYLDESDRDAFGEIIVKQNDGIIESLEGLSNYGIWGINQIRAYLLSLSL